jgi:DNA-binding response OmpR family regulator
MKKILLVEDEAQVVSFINKGLVENGYDVSIAMDGKTGLTLFEKSRFDLIILDIMLPEMNGLELCREIRKADNLVPIIFLTALGTSENVVLGLDTGADDYLVKPFKFMELTARIKSLLRRSEKIIVNNQDENLEGDYFKINDLEIDDYTKTVKRNGEIIVLTSTEYKLLIHFARFKNKVLSRANLLDEVWGIGFDIGSNVVDVYVNYLRKKIDTNSEKKLIHTVVGMGYVLKENP